MPSFNLLRRHIKEFNMKEFPELEVLYHGTSKENAEIILKEGFKPMSFFATDLGTAIGQGGEYVFEVPFVKCELPQYWQVKVMNAIPPNRIMNVNRYDKKKQWVNDETQQAVYDICTEHIKHVPYMFEESNPNFMEDAFRYLEA
jgi:hypothetical protein